MIVAISDCIPLEVRNTLKIYDLVLLCLFIKYLSDENVNQMVECIKR